MHAYVAVQKLEFAAEPGHAQQMDISVMNAGTIMLNVSFNLESHRDLFTVTPDGCQLKPRGSTQVRVSFHAPATKQSIVYERSVMHRSR